MSADRKVARDRLLVGRRRSTPRKKGFAGLVEPLESRAVPTTFTVTSLADDGVGSGNSGDLRYVIGRADALGTGTAEAPDLISFSGVAITPGDHTIRVGTGAAGRIALPPLTDPAVIDGTSAGGFNNLTGLLVTIDGSRLRGGAVGLALRGGNATVEGLQIVNFPGDGVLVTSSGNTIGGSAIGVDASGGLNNPTGRVTDPPGSPSVPPVVVRPPQGDVISGNGGDGVRITGGADDNLLEGNFIGTDVTGIHADGNRGDGVAILNSDGNALIGTTPPDMNNPFVYYNVISGNKGNGLVVDNSNSTAIFADFFGLGADNATPLGNRLDGVLIEGTSDQTNFGANIPLGNVSSANGKNGVEVKGSASRTLLANTFDGVAAFNPSAQVGNRKDGMLVTTSGGGKAFGASNLSTIILTSQLSDNGNDGVEIFGKAGGVQVSQSVIGMDTNGKTPEPNLRDGIEIHGRSSGIAIGGFEPSTAGFVENGSFLEAANLISGNRLDGIAFDGPSRGGSVVNSYIGTDVTGTAPAGNGRDGLSANSVSGLRIGSPLGADVAADRDLIADNGRDDVLLNSGSGDSILGSSIYGAGRLGIDLKGGANRHQAAPALTSAQILSDGSTQLTGLLTSRPNTVYQVEIFASPTGQMGNGQTFLGSASVTTNAAGLAPFTLSGLKGPSGSPFLTATATSPSGDTSMFSRPIEASPINL